VAAGNPDAQRCWPDGESQLPAQIDCFPVDPGVHRCRRANLQERRCPGSCGGARPIGWCVEHKDPKLAGVERQAGTASYGLVQRVSVIRNEHHGRLAMHAPGIVCEHQVRSLGARPHGLLSGLQKRAHFGIAVIRLLDRVAVDAERDVVEEQAPINLGHVDPALDPVAERVERARDVIPVHSRVEGEVIARPGRDTDKRKLVRGRDSGHDREGTVTASHSEGICAVGNRCSGQRSQTLARDHDDNLDILLARPLNDPIACSRPPARPGIDEQHRPPRAFDRAPAATQRVVLDSFGRCRLLCR
jgi:hypothetical protein